MRRTTPVRRLVSKNQALINQVQVGLGAMKKSHRDLIEESIRASFSDSLDLDDALVIDHPNDPRWDYLLGHQASFKVIALEPHQAKSDQVSAVIQKRHFALAQLRERGIKPDIAIWFWVASGKVSLEPLDPIRVRLDREGITFVDRKLLAKHLLGLSRA